MQSTDPTTVTKASGAKALASIARQIDRLRNDTTRELRTTYESLYGIPTRSNNRKYLLDQIAWRMQEHAGVFDDVLRKVDELASLAPDICRRRIAREAGVAVSHPGASANGAPQDGRDARLPPAGTMLEREHQGRMHRVKVLPVGFELDGRPYKTLSEVARAITGTKWSGFLFFEDALAAARASASGARR